MKHMQPIPRLAAVGDNCMDVYDRTGEAYPGGNPVNVAVYTLRLGGAASYTGVVGTDAYGPRMRAAIAAKGVDVSHLRTEPGKTAVSHVELVNGDRVFGDYDEGVMEHFRMTEDDLDFLASHDLVVSGLWGHTGPDLYKLKARGALVAFDCADKLEDPRLDEALPHVDYAFFSHDGSDEAVRAYLQTVLAKGPSLAVATRGERGSVAFDGTRFYEYGIVPCTVVDTMGAGDSFATAMLTSLLQALEREGRNAWSWESFRSNALPQALDKAAAFSARNCLVHGAFGCGVPVPEELRPRMHEGIQ